MERCDSRADYIVSCDGFHGVSRQPSADARREYERLYPFGWMRAVGDAPSVTS
jgi:p-hydroxybenzoate 3-monooxygenase